MTLEARTRKKSRKNDIFIYIFIREIFYSNGHEIGSF